MKVNITCKFGEVDKLHPHGHTGIDLGFAEGTPLRSIRSGVAHLVDYGKENVGKGVIIEHSDGSKEIYGHLSDFSVKDGQQVYAGDQIGLSGGIPGKPGAGHSTGAHLHFGMKDSSGHFIDPSSHVNAVIQQAGDNSHWYDFITTTKGALYDLMVDPKGWLYERASEVITGNLLDVFTDCLSALPICAIVGGCVYFFINMFSKKLAKIGFISTIIYGFFIARSL